MTALLGLACGLLVANVYYAQPLAEVIAQAIGLAPEKAGLLVTLPLAGYGIGLLTLVPLGDLFENRRLVVLLISVEALALAVLTRTSGAAAFLCMGFLVGAAGATVQILVP